MTEDGKRMTEGEVLDIGNQIGLIHGRLAECYSAFMLFKEIERTRDASPFLIDPNTGYGDFWREVRHCALSKTILDIGALVDPDHRRDSASLPSLYDLRASIHGVHCIEAKQYIAEVRATWGNYRHKLIAHTDRRRNELIIEFANEGFTVERMEEQINKLGFAFTVLHATFCGQTPPRYEEGLPKDAHFVAAGEKVRFDTRSFLDAISHHLPQMVG